MISVIIPTYKRSSRLPIAIESVLGQTYSPLEIIVVDDNDDNEYRKETKSVLKKYISQNKITYIQHKSNQGGCVARNTGAFAAKGEYIAFLDDDDFYEPTKLEEQINFLNNNPQLDACMCSMFRIDENNKQIESRENTARGETLKEAILDGNLFTSMLLIKKNIFLKLEGFSEIPRFQDKYFHYKFLNLGYKIGVLNKQLLTLVEHSGLRISYLGAKKIIKSLDLLAEFEKSNKEKFTNQEIKFLKYRRYIKISEVLCEGRFNEKIKSLIYIVKAFIYASTKHYQYIGLLTLKSLTPNAIIKLKTKRDDS